MFTRQEVVVLSLLSQGKQNKDIQEELFITRNTLMTHCKNIYSKLGVKDRTQAAIWGVYNGYDRRIT